MMKRLSLFGICLGIALVLCGRSYAFMQDYNTDKVSVSVMTKYDAFAAGENLNVLVKFRLKDGWHIYSSNPGEIGLPTSVKWRLPAGVRIENERWSPGKDFVNNGIVQNGYDDKAYYLAEIKIPENMKGKADIYGQISWLACREECIKEKFIFNFSLPVVEKFGEPCDGFAKEIIASQSSFMNQKPDNPADLHLLVILAMAFTGGLILNFMPCIFPILTIKAISLAQGTINRAKSRIEALLYMAGVIASFLIIASILVFLRSRGEQIGWGFQLQSPIFVIVMIVIFFIIFLMLLDVVSVRNPFANRVGRISFARRKINAFMTGFFAVLIASPCTAPFMGIAIGYTLAQPIYVYYPVFVALSVGYALPFTLVGFFPKAVHRVLPKPGKWMDILKKVFAIPVFLTCIWLVWVLYSQINHDAAAQTRKVEWEDYSPEKVERLLKENKPVFIDFTAKWCITCLVNKKIALQSDDFVNLAHEKGIALLRADWTNDDTEIAKALEGYGRNSIPLYVYYNGSGVNYKILPQLLTPRILLSEID